MVSKAVGGTVCGGYTLSPAFQSISSSVLQDDS